MNGICGDNRFEIINKVKNTLLEETNIDKSPKELEVLDTVLFRLWQCGYFSLNEQNEQLKQQLKNEKQLNAEIKKRLVEVEYDCEEFNHEYCDPNCNGKRKETIDLYQLISDGLNETLLKQKDEENKQLAKRICEVQSDLSKEKSKVEQIEQLEKRVSYLEDNLCNWRMK